MNKWFMAVVLAATSFIMCNGAQPTAWHYVEPITALGAVAGSAMFYVRQAKPRNKWLGLFVACCVAQQTVRFGQAPLVKQMHAYTMRQQSSSIQTKTVG